MLELTKAFLKLCEKVCVPSPSPRPKLSLLNHQFRARSRARGWRTLTMFGPQVMNGPTIGNNEHENHRVENRLFSKRLVSPINM